MHLVIARLWEFFWGWVESEESLALYLPVRRQTNSGPRLARRTALNCFPSLKRSMKSILPVETSASFGF